MNLGPFPSFGAVKSGSDTGASQAQMLPQADVGHSGKAPWRPRETDHGIGRCHALLGRLLMSLAPCPCNVGRLKSWWR